MTSKTNEAVPNVLWHYRKSDQPKVRCDEGFGWNIHMGDFPVPLWVEFESTAKTVCEVHNKQSHRVYEASESTARQDTERLNEAEALLDRVVDYLGHGSACTRVDGMGCDCGYPILDEEIETFQATKHSTAARCGLDEGEKKKKDLGVTEPVADVTHVRQKNLSVQPLWCLALPIQQQSVLLLGARGPDGIAKAHPCKDVQRAYRGTVLIAAKYGRALEWGEKADSFMSLELMTKREDWYWLLDKFFQHADDLPHHFFMHLMHGAEILGYKHPDPRFRIRWRLFYERCVKELHLLVESEAQMDARLSDWERKHWTIPPLTPDPVSVQERSESGERKNIKI